MNQSNFLLPLASNWKRILARICDLLFFMIIVLTMFFLFPEKALKSSPFSDLLKLLIVNLPSLFFFVLYFAVAPYLFDGQTLGKKMFKIRLQTINQTRIPFWVFLLRESYIILFPLLLSWGIYFLGTFYLDASRALVFVGHFLFFWFAFLFIYQKISPRQQLFYDRWKNIIVRDDKIVNLQKVPVKTASFSKTKLKSDKLEKIQSLFNHSPIKMTSYDYLNSAQKQAVESPPEKNLLIVAGPGTGKTTVLIERVAYLISHYQITSRRILALTFTKKACQNIQNRLAQKFRSSHRDYLVFTYHGFCYDFLCEEISRLSPTPTTITVLDEKDRKNLIKQLLSETKRFATQKRIDKQTINYLTFLIEYMETNVVTNYATFVKKMNEIEELDKSSSELETKKEEDLLFLWNFLSIYKTKKIQDGFMDFWDLLIQAYNLLSQNKDLLKQWQARYDFIVIDEFQDTNGWQYRLIELLSQRGQKIKTTVVGDPDQTIYAWRGAQIEFILEFAKKFVPSVTINLSENYRSTQNITNVANQLIAFNHERTPKMIVSKQEEGDPVILFSGHSSYSQANQLINKIQRLIEAGTQPQDIAILYRSHYLSATLESFLVSRQIPYFVFKGVRFFLRQEVKDMISLLMLVANPANFYTEAVLGWIKNVGPSTVAKIKMLAQAEKLTIFNFLIQKSDHATLQKYPEINEIFGAIAKYHLRLNEIKSLLFLAKDILKKIYGPILENIFLDSERRYKNAKVLLGIIQEFELHNEDQSVKKQILKFFNETKINTASDFIKNPNSVSLMTVHNAKGLEYENVFVYDVSYGKFPSPHYTSSIPEEERRLFFVALTRAKQKLFIFTQLDSPSPFVEEIRNSSSLEEKTDFNNEDSF